MIMCTRTFRYLYFTETNSPLFSSEFARHFFTMFHLEGGPVNWGFDWFWSNTARLERRRMALADWITITNPWPEGGTNTRIYVYAKVYLVSSNIHPCIAHWFYICVVYPSSCMHSNIPTYLMYTYRTVIHIFKTDNTEVDEHEQRNREQWKQFFIRNRHRYTLSMHPDYSHLHKHISSPVRLIDDDYPDGIPKEVTKNTKIIVYEE